MVADYRLWLALKPPVTCPEALAGQPTEQWPSGVTPAYTPISTWNLSPQSPSKLYAHKDQVKGQLMRRRLRRIDLSRQTVPLSRAFR
jgi:hypothetical protein